MSVSRRRFLHAVSLAAAGCPFSLPCRQALATEPNATVTTSWEQISPLVRSVRDLGVQFMNNPINITGQDGATSVALPSGEAFWIFGDTIEGAFDTIRHHNLTEVLSNTASLVPRQGVAQGIKRFEHLTVADGKRARQLIEFQRDEDPAKHRLWAIHGVCVKDYLYVFYHKITMDPVVDVFEDFEANGMGIARARIGEYKFERLHAPDGTTMFWKGDMPGFGVFIETHADGYIYLWGSYWTGMYLARTRPEAIEDVGSYQYLVAAPTPEQPEIDPRWSKTFEPSAVLFDSVPNEMSAAYNRYLKKYVAIHTFNRDNKLVMRTAPKITGPWSKPEIVFQPQRTGSEDLFNAGKEHPELQGLGGKVLYVTYVNSAEYAPHLVEVTLDGMRLIP